MNEKKEIIKEAGKLFGEMVNLIRDADISDLAIARVVQTETHVFTIIINVKDKP